MSFYDDDKKLLLDFNSSLNNKHISHSTEVECNFFKNSDGLFYAIVVPYIKNNSLKGYIEFILDSDYFLSELGNIDNLRVFFEKDSISKRKSELLYTINLGESNLIVLHDMSNDKRILRDMIFKSIFVMSVLFVIMVIILNYSFNILIKRLEILNLNLEKRVSEEIAIRMQKEAENLEKERILINQNKLASMGEMIASIAHQWKQPLGELSAILLKIEILIMKNQLEKEILQKELGRSEEIINFMAKTIDDFRNFFIRDNKVEYFSLNEYIKKGFKLVSSSLKKDDINIEIYENEELFIDGYPRDFLQVILNILNNAKDTLNERYIKNKKIIRIRIFREGNLNIITIKDNAGGITIEPIDRIFEPYFSTKNEKNGVGIGLYMSKIIIENRLKGKLKAYNSENGAVFEISFLNSF